jgi:protein involved in polysaccharide export with SLBB domain
MLLLATAGLTALSVEGQAQTTNPVDPRVPSGSPLNGSNTNRSNSTQQNSGQQVIQQSSPTGPDVVVDSERGFRTSERLIDAQTNNRDGLLRTDQERLRPHPTPGEFEKYIERVLGRELPRFGSDLLVPAQRDFATPATASVPPDYILNPGDVVAIYMTGSIEGSVEREIDTDGKIFLPRVGSIQVAGVRYGDLRDRVSAAIGRQYRGYDVSVEIRRLRGIRVYVTGFAANPGAFTVSSLSTLANAVFAAGGPTAGGSFRSIKLYRRGQEVADFDLYQLVRGGNRSNDVVLQNEDVLFIQPAGPQVALVGSVNQEAIYEAKPGEPVETLLAFAGGPNSLADPTRVILYRNDGQTAGPREVLRPLAQTTEVQGADIIQVLSRGSLVQPTYRQSVLVRIDGEVNRPGNYYVAPNTPMTQVIAVAGGFSPRAFVYGTKLQRTSVRQQQRESFLEAIRQLEISLATAPLTADSTTSAGDREAQLAGARDTLARLREAEPDGRVVLPLLPQAAALPDNILLENNDQIYVPPRATTVGVFGAVYRPASFLLDERQQQRRVRDYVYNAGGPLRAADLGNLFVVRANGEVLSRRRGALSARVLPGDVIFVPVRTQGTNFWARLREISTTIFQVGLSAATIGTLSN